MLVGARSPPSHKPISASLDRQLASAVILSLDSPPPAKDDLRVSTRVPLDLDLDLDLVLMKQHSWYFVSRDAWGWVMGDTLGKGWERHKQKNGICLTSFDPRPNPLITLPSICSGKGGSGPDSGPTMRGLVLPMMLAFASLLVELG